MVVLSTGSSRRWRSADGEQARRASRCRWRRPPPSRSRGRVPERELPGGRDRGDRGAQDHQGGGVVDQALALEHRHQPRGSPTRRPIAVAATASVGLTTAPRAVASANEMPGNSQCTTAPIDQGRDDDEDHRQPGDQAEVAAQVDDREVDRRGVEQRWQHARPGSARARRGSPGCSAGSSRRYPVRRAAAGGHAGPPREHRGRDHDGETRPGDEHELVVHPATQGCAAGPARRTSRGMPRGWLSHAAYLAWAQPWKPLTASSPRGPSPM